MRKIKYALPLLLFSVGILLAANPFSGKWKMNQQKTKYTQGEAPKNEEIVIADKGDQLQVTIRGTDENGKPMAVSYIIPASGGAGQVQQGSYTGVSSKRVNDTTRDTSYTKNGKQTTAEHMVISSDGNTLTVVVKGVDSEGNPVEGTEVFDKQQQ